MDRASIQGWANVQREYDKRFDHNSAIDALTMLLNGDESPGAVATIIVKAYGSYVEQPVKNSDSDRVQPFWTILCHAVRVFGSAQGRLIDLLHQISTQPDMKATDGSLAKGPNGQIYWRQLPGFALALGEDALCSFVLYRTPASANDNILDYNYPSDHSPEELDEFIEQTPYLLNGTRFAATLFERGFRISGLPAEADRLLNLGIESSHNDEHVVKAQAWKVLIPVSAAWITIAGSTIYKMCLDDDKASHKLPPERVWNKQKWEHWKEQLRKFENRDDFDENCRGLAAQAREAMARVELAHQG